MKKFGYLCAILLFIPTLNQAGTRLEDIGYGAVGGGIIAFGLGCLWSARNSEYQLKQFEAQQAAIEQKRVDDQQAIQRKKAEEQQRTETEKFHLIDKVTALEKLFCKINETKTEQLTDLEHKKFHTKVIECAGSVTTFKEQLQTYEKIYDQLSPEAAKEHEHIITTIRNIRAHLHTNHYAKDAEKSELEQKLKTREHEAHVKKTENEAQAAQNVKQLTQETKDMLMRVESKTKHISDELERTVRHELIQLSLILDGRLSRLLSLEQQLAGQQKHNKHIEDKLSQMQQSLQNLKKEILSELHAKNDANNKHIEDRLNQIYQSVQNIEKEKRPELPTKSYTQERQQENNVRRDSQGYPIYPDPIVS